MLLPAAHLHRQGQLQATGPVPLLHPRASVLPMLHCLLVSAGVWRPLVSLTRAWATWHQLLVSGVLMPLLRLMVAQEWHVRHPVLCVQLQLQLQQGASAAHWPVVG